MDCEQLNATVSWQLSGLAVGYVAYIASQNGHNASCVGTDTDTSCVISGLMRGTVYSIWVKALGRQYNSSDSTVVSLMSGKEILCVLWLQTVHTLSSIHTCSFFTYGKG